MQFACGPWERYKDGHPPEKICEEERRSYRLGLAVAEGDSSSFEGSADWFENSLQPVVWGAESSSSFPMAAEDVSIEAGWPLAGWGTSLKGRMAERHDSATSICCNHSKIEEDYEVVFERSTQVASCHLDKSLMAQEVAITIPSSQCLLDPAWKKYSKTGGKSGGHRLTRACRFVCIASP